MKGNLNSSPCLVLNADYQPLSYFPLSLWGWQETIKAVFLNRVNIVAEYDISVKSTSFSMKLPSVISLKKFIPIKKNIPFTRFNLFLTVTIFLIFTSSIFLEIHESLIFYYLTSKSCMFYKIYNN